MTQDIFDQMSAPEVQATEPQEPRKPDKAQTVARPSSELQDNNSTPQTLKQCLQALLKFGLLEHDRKPHLYQTALTQQAALAVLLEPLDLGLQIDDIRGLAWLAVVENYSGEEHEDEWSHPLVRRQRLTLEQSLLVAILRQRLLVHEQEAGIGAAALSIYVDDLIPELQMYLGSLGSDSLEQKRIRALLEKLKGHGVVSELDAHEQISIRPIIVHLANPESLQALLHQYRSLAAQSPTSES